ncbi:hypothetical protein LEMLEM_LOCUS16383 [Lemmus lemmus]
MSPKLRALKPGPRGRQGQPGLPTTTGPFPRHPARVSETACRGIRGAESRAWRGRRGLGEARRGRAPTRPSGSRSQGALKAAGPAAWGARNARPARAASGPGRRRPRSAEVAPRGGGARRGGGGGAGAAAAAAAVTAARVNKPRRRGRAAAPARARAQAEPCPGRRPGRGRAAAPPRLRAVTPLPGAGTARARPPPPGSALGRGLPEQPRPALARKSFPARAPQGKRRGRAAPGPGRRRAGEPGPELAWGGGGRGTGRRSPGPRRPPGSGRGFPAAAVGGREQRSPPERGAWGPRRYFSAGAGASPLTSGNAGGAPAGAGRAEHSEGAGCSRLPRRPPGPRRLGPVLPPRDAFLVGTRGPRAEDRTPVRPEQPGAGSADGRAQAGSGRSGLPPAEAWRRPLLPPSGGLVEGRPACQTGLTADAGLVSAYFPYRPWSLAPGGRRLSSLWSAGVLFDLGSTKAMQVMWPREGLWLLASCGSIYSLPEPGLDPDRPGRNSQAVEPALILPSSPAHLGPMPPPVSSGPPAVSRHVVAEAL